MIKCNDPQVAIFLVADTQLYKRLCLSVRRSVRWSVEVNESKSGKMSILDTFLVCLCKGWGLGCGWGFDAPAHPSATGGRVSGLVLSIADTRHYL